MLLFQISINRVDRAPLCVAMPLLAKEFNIGPAATRLAVLVLDLRADADSRRHADRPLRSAPHHKDQQLCDRIPGTTGIPAATSVLALNELRVRQVVRKRSLIAPHLQAVQQNIADNCHRIGIDRISERHLGLTVNFSLAQVAPDTLTILCTHLRAAPCSSSRSRSRNWAVRSVTRSQPLTGKRRKWPAPIGLLSRPGDAFSTALAAQLFT